MLYAKGPLSSKFNQRTDSEFHDNTLIKDLVNKRSSELLTHCTQYYTGCC